MSRKRRRGDNVNNSNEKIRKKNKCSIETCTETVFGSRKDVGYCRLHLYQLLLRDEANKCMNCEYAKVDEESKGNIWCEKYLIFLNPNWNCRKVKEHYPSILEAVKPPKMRKINKDDTINSKV